MLLPAGLTPWAGVLGFPGRGAAEGTARGKGIGDRRSGRQGGWVSRSFRGQEGGAGGNTEPEEDGEKGRGLEDKILGNLYTGGATGGMPG